MRLPSGEKAPKIGAKNFPTTRFWQRIKREWCTPAIMKKMNGVRYKVASKASDNYFYIEK